MMLTGAIGWNQSSAPGLFLSLLVWLWVIICTSAAILLLDESRFRSCVAAAALTVAAFTVDAALGGVDAARLAAQLPADLRRCAGTASATSPSPRTRSAALLLAGYLAHRFPRAAAPRAALVAVAVDRLRHRDLRGLAVDGTDFGGVIALTPALLWLLLVAVRGPGHRPQAVARSARPPCWRSRSSPCSTGAAGPEKRSHLGNFVQRIIDGDAFDVVSRKAVAAAETIVSARWASAALIVGIALWLRHLPLAAAGRSRPTSTTLRPVAVAGADHRVLGTVLNDGGISVWLTRDGGDRPAWPSARGCDRAVRADWTLTLARRAPVAWPRGRHRRATPGQTPDLAQPWAELGLKADEYARIRDILGRRPTSSELAMYSVMWSEHCSYKSSKVHLRKFGELPPETPIGKLLAGIGENAGVVDVGQGYAVTFKIESHNHPELRRAVPGCGHRGRRHRPRHPGHGRPAHRRSWTRSGSARCTTPDTARVLPGVVAGVGGYGNCLGLPNIGGEVVFDRSYLGNPLVNALCVGVLRHEDLHLAKATGRGNKVILYGAATGGDGIGGVSVLASETFDAASADGVGGPAKRPSVQVGDPFMEKLLIECTLEIFAARLVTGIQDLGGAGLSCATSELASAGDGGMHVDLDLVPLRDSTLSPEEILMSESQERMMAVVEPAQCRRRSLRSAPSGMCWRP